jgi:hypothetical protein
MGVQRKGLKDHGRIARTDRDFGDVAPTKQDMPAVWPLNPGDNPQQSGLTCAAGTQNRKELAGGDSKIHATQRLDSTEPLLDSADRQVHLVPVRAADQA